MFDLNGSEFQGTSIFNGGNAGLVKGVDISVEKKQDDGNTPDYKLIATDPSGSVNVGFYYVTPNPQKTEEGNAKYAKMQVSRVVHIAKAVMGADYQFPAVTSAKEAYDVLFGLVIDNAKDKKFNVYVTYGTKDRPSKYLGFRFFNFIETADNEPTTLISKNVDLLERVSEDSADDILSGNDLGGGAKKVNNNFVI